MKGLNYLAAAYLAIWGGLFFYLLSMGRTATRLEREIDDLKRRRTK